MLDHAGNLKAYDGYENLESFSPQAFESYCRAKLTGCKGEVERIRQQCVGTNWTGKVAEIGSGNSKLLYALELEGILKSGWGYEVSQSRHQFAEAFKKLLGANKTKNLCASIFDIRPPTDLDLVCAMDIVIQMISPLSRTSERDLFHWIRDALKPGGYLLAELRDMSALQAIVKLSDMQTYCFWEEFPSHDPWRYNLNRVSFVSPETDRDLLWEKRFLKRDSLETSEFSCVWRSYSPQDMTSLLREHGLVATQILPGKDGWYTLIAKKNEI